MTDGFQAYNRELWTLRSGIKSRIPAKVLTNKVDLHELLLARGLGGQLVPDSIVVRDSITPVAVPDDDTWIWRPDMVEGSGTGIKMVQRQSDLDDARRAHFRAYPKRGAVLTRYIGQPALLTRDGQRFKFHLRVYFLVVLSANRRDHRAAVYRAGGIALAKQVGQTFFCFTKQQEGGRGREGERGGGGGEGGGEGGREGGGGAGRKRGRGRREKRGGEGGGGGRERERDRARECGTGDCTLFTEIVVRNHCLNPLFFFFFFFLSFFLFYTNQKPYSEEVPDDDTERKARHDTHLSWGADNRWPRDFPSDLPVTCDQAFAQIHSILARVAELTLPTLEPYSESPVAYDILGCDFLVDATGRVWLLEINAGPCLLVKQNTPERVNWLSNLLFGGLCEFVLQAPTDPASLQHVAPCFIDGRAVPLTEPKAAEEAKEKEEG